MLRSNLPIVLVISIAIAFGVLYLMEYQKVVALEAKAEKYTNDQTDQTSSQVQELDNENVEEIVNKVFKGFLNYNQDTYLERMNAFSEYAAKDAIKGFMPLEDEAAVQETNSEMTNTLKDLSIYTNSSSSNETKVIVLAVSDHTVGSFKEEMKETYSLTISNETNKITDFSFLGYFEPFTGP